MIIDGHAHSSGEFFRAENLIETLDRAHAAKVVLCPGLPSNERKQNSPRLAYWFPRSDLMFAINRIIRVLTYPTMRRYPAPNNQYVYELTQRCPDRVIQCYWLNPKIPNALSELDQCYSNWHFKMIKLHQPSDYFRLDHPLLAEMIRFAIQHQLPIFLHLYSKRDVIECIGLADKFPEANFIIAHLIGLEIFARHAHRLSNLYFDISPMPLISDRRILATISTFGADHVLLGSDTPFGRENLVRNIERVQRLPISDHHKALILGGNLQRLLCIS